MFKLLKKEQKTNKNELLCSERTVVLSQRTSIATAR